jgi:hypothetical protein
MLPALQQPPSRLALNFVRRYKWAFRPEYERLCPQVAAPNLSEFANAAMEVLKDKREPLRFHFERARDGLANLHDLPTGAAGPWHKDRLKVRVTDSPWAAFQPNLSCRSLNFSLLLPRTLRS